ncbi:hypothetical protein BC834DRAFT_207232 [Gloeopeniophorella convolvens]|nr:hypothetical protein BC834DRAFT_207232 [Gloeopeniophorella convolvens]
MAIKLDIIPSSSSLDILGQPDQSAAYSLSGHVSISLTSSHSIFERRRAVRILLQSLVITFEGQAELVAHESGYAPARLCALSKELAPKTTVELSNEGDEDGDRPCTWHVTFDLPVPGWLPASDAYGDARQGFSGTQYTLYATARFTHQEADACAPSWFSALCTPLFFRNRVVHAEPCSIALNRFALPPPSAGLCPMNVYAITSTGDAAVQPKDVARSIPTDIMSKIELLASTPERVNMDDNKIPFVLRLRAPGLSDEQASKLRVSDVSVELHQFERFSCSAHGYAARYPLPKERDQPPNRPLRQAHPVHTLYEIGLLSTPTQISFEDAHSLLPGFDQRLDLPLRGTGHVFARTDGTAPTRWFAMETHVPFAHALPERKDESLAWTGAPRLRASGQSPFFGVRHALRVAVQCTYDDDSAAAPASDCLSFSLPLEFVRLRGAARSPPPRTHSLPGYPPTLVAPAPVTMPPTHPYNVPELPAYSQLFYANGDERYDDPTPLPLYTPAHSPDASRTSLSDADSDDGLDASDSTPLLSLGS